MLRPEILDEKCKEQLKCTLKEKGTGIPTSAAQARHSLDTS